jgi:transmembrane sensor
MSKDINDAAALLDKYNRGEASPEEIRMVEHWYLQISATRQSEPMELDYLAVKKRIWKAVYSRTGTRRNIVRWPYYVSAAAVLAAVVTGIYFYNYPLSTIHHPPIAAVHDIGPGNNKAFLILENGTQIALSQSANGLLAKQAGAEIMKTAEGKIIYNNVKYPDDKGAVYNAIVTPRGGQYQLQLPDGTRVWLNAASRLKYPVSFIGLSSRSVELTGEAYFEVARDESRPFIVKNNGLEVKVLGTDFNVNAYSEESFREVTLLKGAIKVNNTLLKPGEQAQLSKTGKLVIGKGDVEAASWKDGTFKFADTDLNVVLRELGRWYDLDIIYMNGIPDRKFTGYIDRRLSADQALDILKVLKINLQIKGQTIYVAN